MFSCVKWQICVIRYGRWCSIALIEVSHTPMSYILNRDRDRKPDQEWLHWLCPWSERSCFHTCRCTPSASSPFHWSPGSCYPSGIPITHAKQRSMPYTSWGQWRNLQSRRLSTTRGIVPFPQAPESNFNPKLHQPPLLPSNFPHNNPFITSAKEGMFLPDFVCLSVCLSVC